MSEAPRTVIVHLWREGDWIVAHCPEVDVASQGRSEEEAIRNIREALELYFEHPLPTGFHQIRTLELAIA